MIELKTVNSDNLCSYFVYTQAHTHTLCVCVKTQTVTEIEEGGVTCEMEHQETTKTAKLRV